MTKAWCISIGSTYQNIIIGLPLKQGYRNELIAYNYDPNSIIVFMKVQIISVLSVDYIIKKPGKKSFKETKTL